MAIRKTIFAFEQKDKFQFIALEEREMITGTRILALVNKYVIPYGLYLHRFYFLSE